MTAEPNASARIEVSATADEVYELVSDPGILAELAEEYSGYAWLDGAQCAKIGARFRGRNRKGLRKWSTLATVTDAVPGRRFAFEVSALGFPVARWQYDIEPGESGCQVTESTWDRRNTVIRFAGDVASGVTDRAAHSRRNMETTLARLKVRAELPNRSDA
ncbi:polyketide cyclase/dehydrase/lipid transport protein [Tamaricihabitans halophyticus]|uniref:Polyketide cyclase/dehydrase/lipid transport protein n=1 Tax=Tamaricihabitans halophyticus TaxID=1262583 RepID=A0A4R2RD09_9PSEU|nr:SRPBCC family protein [Tamaricihabitans halophyticus]TCP57305.1 polyketide cyclase/dehydrase/lipid transport protein [Tamaricihabitans halophyticus]